MSTFVLIHGAWHGAWCWYKVAPLLQSRGHTVVTPDLPALGIDRTPLASTSLQSYTEHVCKILDGCAEPVHLVGHSMGGLVITQAAEAMPHKVKKLVYLTAFLLPSGRSLLQEVETDTTANVAVNFVFAPDQSSATVKPEALSKVFYADCSPADLALAQSLLVPQAVAPLATPVQTSAERWGRVPRAYIECTEDNAISVTTQRGMYARLPCQQVFSMATSHSPFLSAPEALAGHLLS